MFCSELCCRIQSTCFLVERHSGSKPFLSHNFAVAGNKGGSQQETDQASTDDKANPFQIKKKTKKAAQPLCRPIIAVCNDMYAPALRPLRGVAKIVQFKKPSVSIPLSLVCLFWFSASIRVIRSLLFTAESNPWWHYMMLQKRATG